ncbi:MAG TPA: uroporphyrinogen-III synthase, partial [Anaerolineae bacterium]|nr:uroporphyrinogen-III synthase [Anaerolineae bacterium]
GARLAAIGPATAASLALHGVRADCVPDEYIAEAVGEALGDVTGRRIMLPRADIARKALPDMLRAGGATVVEVDAYRTIQPAIDRDDLAALLSCVTVATFTSSSTVHNLASMARAAGLRLPAALTGATVACIGPVTADTARDEGLTVDIVAEEYTIDGLIQAIVGHASRITHHA